jgi:chemotaxis protein MotB
MPIQIAQPVIIIKRRKVHGNGHHGGAWKVAFADFVTALLALFIVLWLLSSSEQVKKAVGGYFTDPPKGKGKDIGNGLRGSGNESLSIRKDDMDKLKNTLEQAVNNATALREIKEHVIFTVTGEGLRVELVEGEKATFFESGSPHPTDFGRDLLKKLAEEIGKLPNSVTMEGHTDSRPYVGQDNYSNWELSADRANAARRWMEMNGMRKDQVIQIRGFADHSLRDPSNAASAANRRITVIIQYQAANPSAANPPIAVTPTSAKPSPVSAALDTNNSQVQPGSRPD